MVGPVEAVSLAKPSKPADEEKFALLIGCVHRRTRCAAQVPRAEQRRRRDGSAARCSRPRSRRSAAGASGQPAGAARQRRGAAATSGCRSAASNCTASAATGSRAAARTCECGSNCKSPARTPACCKSRTAASCGSTAGLPTGRTVTRIDLRQLRADPVLSAGESGLDPAGRGELVADPAGTDCALRRPAESAGVARRELLVPAAAGDAAGRGAAAGGAADERSRVRGRRPLEAGEAGGCCTGASQESRVESREPESDAQMRSCDRLPQEVLLLVGQADLFPYRIEYRRLETPRAAERRWPPIPYQLSANPMVVLELSDVAFDVPIAAGQFDYTPGDVDWVDQTAQAARSGCASSGRRKWPARRARRGEALAGAVRETQHRRR